MEFLNQRAAQPSWRIYILYAPAAISLWVPLIQWRRGINSSSRLRGIAGAVKVKTITKRVTAALKQYTMSPNYLVAESDKSEEYRALKGCQLKQ